MAGTHSDAFLAIVTRVRHLRFVPVCNRKLLRSIPTSRFARRASGYPDQLNAKQNYDRRQIIRERAI
jgi:hypothetical protein